MQDKVKYRLAGLGALILSAAVFSPLFMDGEGYKERHVQQLITDMPVAPKVVSVEVPTVMAEQLAEVVTVVEGDDAPEVLLRPEPIAPVAAPAPAIKVPKLSEETASRLAEAKPAVSLKETPALDVQGAPVAWSLQLGTFSNEENAEKLKNQLVDAGHKVYIRRAGKYVQLFVGPDLQKSRLSELKSKIDAQHGLKSKLVRFSTN